MFADNLMSARASRGPVALIATLGFALPSAYSLRASRILTLSNPANARTSRLTLSAPQRRTYASKPPPPGTLPPTLASSDASEGTVYTGNVTPRALSEREKKVVAYRQEYRCAGCSCLLPPGYQVDHIQPLALGGTNGLTNLQALCTRCHTRKTRGQRHEMLTSRAAREAAASEAVTPNAAALRSVSDAEEVTEEEEEEEEVTEEEEAEAGVSEADRLAASPETSGAALSLDAVELSSLRLLRGMNQQQLAAVVCSDGPVRVAAGPGTGKTRVLTARLAHLIVEANVPPQRVLAVTFTNKAARELRERITRLVGPDEADSITMGTFHSLCLAMLRQDITKLPEHLAYRSGFAVYDEYASLKLIKKLKTRLEGGAITGAAQRTRAQKDKDDFSAGTVQAIISSAKNEGYDAQAFRAAPPHKLLRALPPSRLNLVAAVFEQYQATMRAENIIDFDDMLLLTEQLLRTSERTRRKYAGHWRHLLVDEFQDTNALQYALLHLLGARHRNVFVVGDADQG